MDCAPPLLQYLKEGQTGRQDHPTSRAGGYRKEGETTTTWAWLVPLLPSGQTLCFLLPPPTQEGSWWKAGDRLPHDPTCLPAIYPACHACHLPPCRSTLEALQEGDTTPGGWKEKEKERAGLPTRREGGPGKEVVEGEPAPPPAYRRKWKRKEGRRKIFPFPGRRCVVRGMLVDVDRQGETKPWVTESKQLMPGKPIQTKHSPACGGTELTSPCSVKKAVTWLPVMCLQAIL